MNGASKILTVSYGTFSCTLEGFDDPFNTMKAIAEYFRDLAAGDRYFGAEPPQPDAAMLHRIAEREIQRRVDARVEDNSVVLRAGDSLAPRESLPIAAEMRPAPVQPLAQSPAQPLAPVTAAADGAGDSVQPSLRHVEAAAPAMDLDAVEDDTLVAAAADDVAEDFDAVPDADFSLPETVVNAAADDDSQIEDLEEIGPGAGHDAPHLREAMPEGVAAKLARLRQSVQHGAPVPAAPAAADAMAAETPDNGFAEDLPRRDFQPVDGFAAFAAEAEVTAAPLVFDDEGGFDDTDADDDWEELDGRPDGTAESDAVLGRLDALLTASAPAEVAAPAVPAASAQEDDLARMLSVLAEDSLRGAATAELTASAPELPAELPAELAPELAPEDEDEDLASYAASDSDGGFDAQAPRAGLTEAAAAPSLAELVAEINGTAPTAAEMANLEPAAVEPATVMQPGTAAPADLPAAEVAAQPVLHDAPRPVSDKLQRARARVIKVRRIDLAPLAEGEVPHASALPVGESEEDVERLIKKAGDEMAVPEIQRRQAAIQHLKAAVAATAAERRAGAAQPGDGQRDGAYRADLAKVAVRPVRPQPQEESARTLPPEADPAAERAAATPAPQRPAPLILFSTQRVDRPSAAPQGGVVMPVRPRRVAGGAAAGLAAAPLHNAALHEAIEPEDTEAEAALLAALGEEVPDRALQLALGGEGLRHDADEDDEEESGNIFHDSGDFMDFAGRLGATAMPELLEAAAAYATCVEKREHFTRPLLMRRLVNGDLGEQISREDGLRGFGTLLREGRIAKVRRGQYALPEDSPLLAEARKLAG